MKHRGLNSLLAICALLLAAPVALCQTPAEARDCCQGEHRVPCGPSNPDSSGQAVSAVCCVVAPGAPAALPIGSAPRPDVRHPEPDNSTPMLATGTWPAGLVPPAMSVPLPPDEPRLGSGSRELYLLTRRLRL